MWARLPVPKVTFGDECIGSLDGIQFCMGKEENRGNRLQETVVCWLLVMSQDSKHTDKIAHIVVNALFGGQPDESSPT